MLWGALSLVLFSLYTGVLVYYKYGWLLSGKKSAGIPESIIPVSVSVIIPARNEAANIQKCLNAVLAQEGEGITLEIIVADDDSSDNTCEIVEAVIKLDDRVKLVRLKHDEETRSHKKRAVEAGIAAASGKLIACTDADCVVGKRWLYLIAGAYKGGEKKFIAAPVVYYTLPNLLSVFQTLDFMTLQGITAASVATNFHTMCNGANIAYERQAFYDVQGFSGIDMLPTGDDMLLMYKMYKRYPDGIEYMRHTDAIVSTEEARGWSGFFQQRIRWASKAAFYDDKRIFWVLLLVYTFNFWIAVLAVAGIWNKTALLWFCLMLLGKTIAELVFLMPVAKFFGKTRWMIWFPFLQPVHIVYTLIAGWLGRFGSYTWKGRTIAKPAALKT